MVKQLECLLDFMRSRTSTRIMQDKGRHFADRYKVLEEAYPSYKTTNLYQVNNKVIKPMTQPLKCSYVEAVAFSEKAQLPTWFASHWWGEPLHGSVASLKAHAQLRHPESDAVTSSYWICAFANGQHDLKATFGDNPEESCFYNALRICRGMVLLLDAGSPARAFDRIWCNFEASLATSALSHLLLDIVAQDETGQACILTDGMTLAETTKDTESLKNPWEESGRTAQVKREERFPVDIMHKGLYVSVANAKATSPQDKHQILNIVAGKTGSAAVDLGLPVYEETDKRLRSRFATLSIRLGHFALS